MFITVLATKFQGHFLLLERGGALHFIDEVPGINNQAGYYKILLRNSTAPNDIIVDYIPFSR